MSEFSVSFWDASPEVRREKLQAYLCHHCLGHEEIEVLIAPFLVDPMSEAKFTRCVNELLTGLATGLLQKAMATKK